MKNYPVLNLWSFDSRDPRLVLDLVKNWRYMKLVIIMVIVDKVMVSCEGRIRSIERALTLAFVCLSTKIPPPQLGSFCAR